MYHNGFGAGLRLGILMDADMKFCLQLSLASGWSAKYCAGV